MGLLLNNQYEMMMMFCIGMNILPNLILQMEFVAFLND